MTTLDRSPAASSLAGPALASADRRAASSLAERAEELLGRVEALPDPGARAVAMDLVRSVLDLYGEGMARTTAMTIRLGGERAREELADDELVAHLLLLHGLHPFDAATRARRAIKAVRPHLSGAEPELVSVDGDTVRLRLRAPGGGCRSSVAAARAALTDAIRDSVPEIERVEIDEPAPPPVVVPLANVGPRP